MFGKTKPSRWHTECGRIFSRTAGWSARRKPGSETCSQIFPSRASCARLIESASSANSRAFKVRSQSCQTLSSSNGSPGAAKSSKLPTQPGVGQRKKIRFFVREMTIVRPVSLRPHGTHTRLLDSACHSRRRSFSRRSWSRTSGDILLDRVG